MLVVDQFLRRLRDQLRPLARTAFEKQQALAEDEAIEQELFRARVKPGRTLTVCEAQAFAERDGTENLIATMTGTLMALPRRG